MKDIIKNLFITGFFLFSHIFLLAQPIVTIDEKVKKYPLGLNLEILEDKSGKLDFNEICSKNYSDKFFVSKKEKPNFGFTKSVYWARLVIKNKFLKSQDYFLEITYPPLDYIELYIINSDGSIITKKSGDQVPFSQRELSYTNFLFSIPLEARQKQTIYFRFKTQSSMQFPITLWRSDALVEYSAKKNYFQGIYYGIMLAMLLYNIFLFFSIKDKSYVYYVLYILFFSLYQLSLHGFAYQYVFPEFPKLANWSHPLSIGISLFFMTLFVRSFLDLTNQNKILYRLFYLFTIIAFLSTILSFILNYQTIIRFFAFFVITTFSSTILSGILVWKKGYQAARFFLLAWCFYLAGGLLFALKTFGAIPTSFLTNYSVQIGSAVEVILLSLALADRFKKEQQNKIRMEMELNTASAVQNALFPEENPQISNLDIYGACKTASEIGGDWYGYSTKFSDYIYLFIGDVTGHGTPAALVTAAVCSAMKQIEEFLYEEKTPLPHELNQILNRRVCETGNFEYFMTFLTMRIELKTGKMVYSNAGHCYPFLYRDRSAKPLLSDNLPMFGMVNEVNYKDSHLQLFQGDLLFLYTDGLTEAKNKKGEMFDEKGLEETILEVNSKSSKEIVEGIFKKLERYCETNTNSFRDDVTMISLKVLERFL